MRRSFPGIMRLCVNMSGISSRQGMRESRINHINSSSALIISHKNLYLVLRSPEELALRIQALQYCIIMNKSMNYFLEHNFSIFSPLSLFL